MKSASIAAALLAGSLFGAPPLLAQEIADTIYFGGPILTINDAQPTAEAVAVKGGRILAVGRRAAINSYRGKATVDFNLAGRAMLPGFVDAHGHVFMGGIQALSANMLAPPDGEVKDIASLIQTLKDWTTANQSTVDKIQIIVGFGYDNAMLAELRHPTRKDLDQVSRDIPVCIVHQSGHLFAVNTRALEVCGVTADTPNPAGGVIRRGDDGKEPNGVLEETAGFPVIMKLLSRAGVEGAKQFARSGAELWARFGYTTAQEGRSVPAVASILRAVADEGGLKVDVVTYPDVLVDREFIKTNVSQEYKNRLRVGGAKLTIDGSPQGFTAWRDRPYYRPVGKYPPGYRGYPAATDEQVISAVDWAYEHKIQILTHSNGEAASDLLIAAIDAATRKHGADDRRPVLIHGQFLREDQIDSFNRLAVIPSLFPMHTYYWGDWHRDHTVGPALADNISPTGWCVKRGMRFTSHHDAPVAFPNSMRVLDATVTRRSRSGDIIGPDQRVDVMTALKAMTIWPAWQHFEEKSKGSIETGKLADFVILDKDPTAIDPETIDQIKVLETIKEGVTIFDIAGMKKAGASIRSGDAGQLAFARAMAATASHQGQDHERGEAYGGGCLCGAMAQLAAIIAGAEEKYQNNEFNNKVKRETKPQISFRTPLLAPVVCSLAATSSPAQAGKSGGVAQIIQADGFQLEAFVFGDGPVSLIMAAGNGRPATQLDDLARAISANGIKVVTYNYRTLGASTGKIDNLTLHDWANDVWRVADGLGLQKVFLAGKTYGNRVVRTASQDHPDRVLGVILIGAGGEIPPEKETIEKYKRYLDPAISKEEWLKLQGELMYAPGNEELAKLDQAQGEFPALAAAQAKASDATPKDQWRLGGTAPMLILTGLHDIVAVPESALQLAKSRPKAWLVALPACGHNMLNERGDDIKRLMVEFILHTPSDAVKPATP